MRRNLATRMFAASAMAAALVLAGCAAIEVDVRQKLYQGEPELGLEANRASETAGNRQVQAMQDTARAQEPGETAPSASTSSVANSTSGTANFRKREAVKQSQYLWGLWTRTQSDPVAYDYYRRTDDGWYFGTNMTRNHFYLAQPAGNESTLQALLRAGVGDGKGSVHEDQLMPLDGVAQPITVLAARFLTLGIFWDSGYTADTAHWPLRNVARKFSWLGKSEVIIAMDQRGNFYVRDLQFDPSRTVRKMAQLTRNTAAMALQAQLAPNFVQSAPDEMLSADGKAFRASVQEWDAKIRLQQEISVTDEKPEQINQKVDTERATARKELKDILASQKQVLDYLGGSDFKTKTLVDAAKLPVTK